MVFPVYTESNVITRWTTSYWKDKQWNGDEGRSCEGISIIFQKFLHIIIDHTLKYEALLSCV